MSPDDREVGEDEHKDGTVDSPETTEVERERRPRLGDFGGGVGGRSRTWGSSAAPIVTVSSWSNELGPEGAQGDSVGDVARSAGSEALAGEVGSFVPGASRAGIPSSSAFSPFKNIRESLITLSVGRRE